MVKRGEAFYDFLCSRVLGCDGTFFIFEILHPVWESDFWVEDVTYEYLYKNPLVTAEWKEEEV